MRVIFGLSNFKRLKKRGVLVIGVFDGLHRGHRYLIKRSVSCARRLRKRVVCLTFHPHPQGLPYLMSLEHRLRLIAELGVDYCVVVPFNLKFAKIRAEDFIEKTLVKIFRPIRIFIGDEFRFGYRARGNVDLLKSYENQFGFKVIAVKELKREGKVISSNLIRSLLRRGELREAEKLLGRKISILGRVIHGLRRGRLLGIKTANIDPHQVLLPLKGVYAVKIVYRGKVYSGLCNVGVRPTFFRRRMVRADKKNVVVEAHILDFKKEIYGEDIEIQFVRRLRNEKKFSSERLLLSQIGLDRKRAIQLMS